MTSAWDKYTELVADDISMEPQELAECIRVVTLTCEEYMKRFASCGPPPNKMPNWWSPELTQLRNAANRARRRMQKARSKPHEIFQTRKIEFKRALKDLRRNIVQYVQGMTGAL